MKSGTLDLRIKFLSYCREYSFCLQGTTDLPDLDASLCYISLRSMNFWLITFIKEAEVGLVCFRAIDLFISVVLEIFLDTIYCI